MTVKIMQQGVVVEKRLLLMRTAGIVAVVVDAADLREGVCYDSL